MDDEKYVIQSPTSSKPTANQSSEAEPFSWVAADLLRQL